MVRGEALALEKEEVLSSRVRLRFGHEPRFANACLTAEQDDTRLPVPDLIQNSMEGGKFVGATDYGWTDQGPVHYREFVHNLA